MVLQQPLRKRTIVFPAWGEDRLFYGQAHTEMDVFEMVPLWIAGVNSLKEAIKLFWTIRVPWGWTYTAGMVPDWTAQFSFGFYSLMLTSLLIGLIVMFFFKPRSWCAFCPMGTMTQVVCKLKNKENRE